MTRARPAAPGLDSPVGDGVLGSELGSVALVGGAVRGAVILMGRNLGVQVLALGATIVLARLLSPSEFGAFAVAAAIQQAGMVVVNFGLPAALIRREIPPSSAELQAASGFVLAIGAAATVAAIGLAFVVLPALGGSGEIAKLAALACLSLPILGVQIAPIVLLNRKLDFRRIAIIEVADAIAFYAFAIVAALAGLGTYSLAGAVVFSALVGMLIAFRVQPWDRGFRLDPGLIRTLASFGLQVGAFQSATIVRELGFVALLAALGGQALAGFYGMARRLFSLPFAAMTALQRVGLPALAQLPRGRTRARQTAKAVAVGSLAVGLPMALIAGAADPLVSVAFGPRWLPAADLTVLASAGVLLFASAGTMVVSLELAEGDARTPLASIGLQLLVLLGLSVALVPDHGASGAGIALGASFAVFTAAVIAGAPREARSAVAPVLRGVLVAGLAALAGRAVQPGSDGVAAVASMAATGATWLALAIVVCRSELRLLLSLIRRHVLGSHQSPD
jgi:O-antigen/teichoic acid export membrane protein